MSKLIVIGAGVAGLSTAVHAARNGYEVEVLEHHSEPGGVCTAWERQDYRIEGCIHWLVGATPKHPMWQLYREIGATDGIEFLPVDHFVRLVDEPTGITLDFGSDLDRTLAEVEAISPVDRAVFQEIVDAGRNHDLMSMLPLDAPELTSVGSWIATGWRSRKDLLWMMTHKTSMAELQARVRHPVLREFVGRLFPDIPFAFATTVLGELSRGSLATIRGGSHHFARAIARKVVELGGTIRYGHDVESILVENDRAVGVRSVGGVEHRADRVVSCAPGHTTIFRMLGGRYTDDSIRRRYTQWPLFEPIALVSFGAKEIWKDLPRSNLFHLEHPFVIGPREIGELSVRNYAFDPSLAPAGHSVIQAMVPTDFDLWHDLHHAPARYAEKKAELAHAVLGRIERHAPGIGAAVDMTDVATPYTYWRFARTHRGAYEGFMPTVETMAKHVPKTLPGLDRFHMAGQWVEPGGGIPPAVYSGRQVVQLICDDDGRNFVSG